MHTIIVLAVCAVIGFVVGCGQKTETAETPPILKEPESTIAAVSDTKADVESKQPAAGELLPPTVEGVGDKEEVAVIETVKGQIVLEFFPEVAPLHVANFKQLARAGFYDGTNFHRVLPGFVIQGGDPNSKDGDPNNDGTGGPPYNVPAEFNDRPHEHGTLSMARSQDVNSAGSQFFICLDRVPHLDNQYTVFGKVIKGLDVVDAIGSMRRDPSNPQDRVKPAIVVKKVSIIKRTEVAK